MTDDELYEQVATEIHKTVMRLLEQNSNTGNPYVVLSLIAKALIAEAGAAFSPAISITAEQSVVLGVRMLDTLIDATTEQRTILEKRVEQN